MKAEMNAGAAKLCWAHCPTCGHDFHLGCVVPCPVDVYLAALKAARCPQCGEGKRLEAYSPGAAPSERPNDADHDHESAER